MTIDELRDEFSKTTFGFENFQSEVYKWLQGKGIRSIYSVEDIGYLVPIDGQFYHISKSGIFETETPSFKITQLLSKTCELGVIQLKEPNAVDATMILGYLVGIMESFGFLLVETRKIGPYRNMRFFKYGFPYIAKVFISLDRIGCVFFKPEYYLKQNE